MKESEESERESQGNKTHNTHTERARGRTIHGSTVADIFTYFIFQTMLFFLFTRYGEVEYKEIMIRLNSFLASASITVGKINGETRLPLPPLHNQEADAMNKDLVHALEGAVVTWTAQIKAILERSHESSLKHGDNPTPDEELRFWESQSANLNAIFLQLKSKQMRNVMIFLDQCKSVYCAPFARLCKEVFAARLESNNNVKFLRTLEKWFKTLNTADDLNDLKDLFRPMLHIILLIWKNSKYYNTPQRLSVLVRKVCNAIINRCCSFLSGKAILGKITDWENIKDAQTTVDGKQMWLLWLHAQVTTTASFYWTVPFVVVDLLFHLLFCICICILRIGHDC
jgi:dynein heavy chain